MRSSDLQDELMALTDKALKAGLSRDEIISELEMEKMRQEEAEQEEGEEE